MRSFASGRLTSSLQVEQAYWDLVFSLRNLQVQIDAVKQARTQLESNQRLVAKGVLAPIEIVAANTQITTFEQNVYTAQEDVTRAENTLKTLMLKERSSEIWLRSLTPITPVEIEAPRVPLESAVGDAIRNRLELQQIQTNTEINQINTRFYREQTKPQVDLIANYTATVWRERQMKSRASPARLMPNCWRVSTSFPPDKACRRSSLHRRRPSVRRRAIWSAGVSAHFSIC